GLRTRQNFTETQVKMMSEVFQTRPYPTKEMIMELGRLMLVPEERIKVWFQNRRQRLRSVKNINHPER
ncbi:hypothetical protein HHI36_020012, partial [Cryptolaemus montrouzieri]